MAGTRALDPTAREAATPSAVVWIDGRQAIVHAVSDDGRISTCEISRGWLRKPSYLALVAGTIGDRERVVILGPRSVCLALEREYVASFRRPDRLIDVEPSGPVPRDDLVDRLRRLAS